MDLIWLLDEEGHFTVADLGSGKTLHFYPFQPITLMAERDPKAAAEKAMQNLAYLEACHCSRAADAINDQNRIAALLANPNSGRASV